MGTGAPTIAKGDVHSHARAPFEQLQIAPLDAAFKTAKTQSTMVIRAVKKRKKVETDRVDLLARSK